MVQPGTALARGRYAITASYNYTTFPSYVAQSGPIQTHVVGVRGAVGLTQRVTGQLGLNFARSISSYNQGTVAAFDTYGTTVGLAYLATSALQASLTYNWLNFADRSPDPAVINNGLQYGFSKHMIMLSLSYVFTQTPGFFRSEGLQETIGTGGGGSSSRAGQGSGSNSGDKESK